MTDAGRSIDEEVWTISDEELLRRLLGLPALTDDADEDADHDDDERDDEGSGSDFRVDGDLR